MLAPATRCALLVSAAPARGGPAETQHPSSGSLLLPGEVRGSQCLQASVQAGEGASRKSRNGACSRHGEDLPVMAGVSPPSFSFTCRGDHSCPCAAGPARGLSILSPGRRGGQTRTLPPLRMDVEAEELLNFHLASLVLRGETGKKRGCLRRIRCVHQSPQVIGTNTAGRRWVISSQALGNADRPPAPRQPAARCTEFLPSSRPCCVCCSKIRSRANEPKPTPCHAALAPRRAAPWVRDRR